MTPSPAPLEIPRIEGCPVEIAAVAMELGTTPETIQIAIGNLKKKLEREERIHDLMEKIKSTPVKKHEIIAAKKQLEALERKFRQLSRKSYKSERLESLKERIDELKQKLAIV